MPEGSDPTVGWVTYGSHRLPVTPGGELAFGRATTCDIRLPADDHISRRAGVVRGLDDCLLVRNDSASKPLLLRPPAGTDRVVEPGAATTSLPYREFQIIVLGRAGALVALDVEVDSVSGAAPDAP